VPQDPERHGKDFALILVANQVEDAIRDDHVDAVGCDQWRILPLSSDKILEARQLIDVDNRMIREPAAQVVEVDRQVFETRAPKIDIAKAPLSATAGA
jgi:hypothetical protein